MEKNKVKIFDTTLRDGEQSPGVSLRVEEKLPIAKQLSKLGVDVIEAGFPVSSEGDFKAVKLIAQEIEGPVICGLARTVEEDIDRAWEAVKYSSNPRIHVFISTSDIHIEKKLRKSKEQVKEMVKKGVQRAKSYTDNVEFSPEDAARTNLDYMCKVVEKAINAGATTINIPDTVGYAQPEEFAQRIKKLQERVPSLKKDIDLSVHCHDDLGNAVANSLAAVRAGANQVECAVNGIGERAGNASTEEIIMNLETRSDFFKCSTGINTKEIFKTSKLVSQLTGMEVPRNKAIVGKNAFAHEAGIHQHGMLHSKETYEIMSPESIGWEGESFVIGKHSGKHAVQKVVEDMGYELNEKEIEKVTQKVKQLAQKNKQVTKSDLSAIASEVATHKEGKEDMVVLEDMEVNTGDKKESSAKVSLKVDGQTKKGESTGIGSVDALYKAIKNIVEIPITLKDYRLKAITGGTNALADVTITLQYDQDEYLAKGIDEDIIMASAKAMTNGANKIMKRKKK